MKGLLNREREREREREGGRKEGHVVVLKFRRIRCVKINVSLKRRAGINIAEDDDKRGLLKREAVSK